MDLSNICKELESLSTGLQAYSLVRPYLPLAPRIESCALTDSNFHYCNALDSLAVQKVAQELCHFSRMNVQEAMTPARQVMHPTILK